MSNSKPDVEALEAIAEAAIAASLWTVDAVAAEPEIALVQWSIRRDTAGASYFVGARADDYTGRVSTRVVEFDPKMRRGRTASGRVYELLGPPGYSADAEYVWEAYKRVNQIVEAEPVSGAGQ